MSLYGISRKNVFSICNRFDIVLSEAGEVFCSALLSETLAETINNAFPGSVWKLNH